MTTNSVMIQWPNGKCSRAEKGQAWLEEAKRAGITIPIGCLAGRCGACEIEVNGKIIRACISRVMSAHNAPLSVDWATDPLW